VIQAGRVGADLDLDVRARAWAGPLEDLVRFMVIFDRPAGLAAQDRGHRLEVDADLAAEAAADSPSAPP